MVTSGGNSRIPNCCAVRISDSIRRSWPLPDSLGVPFNQAQKNSYGYLDRRYAVIHDNTPYEAECALLNPYPANFSINSKILPAVARGSRFDAPSINSPRAASTLSLFCLLIALMVSYALRSGTPPSSCIIRMICSW